MSSRIPIRHYKPTTSPPAPSDRHRKHQYCVFVQPSLLTGYERYPRTIEIKHTNPTLLRRRHPKHKETQAKLSQNILVNPYNPGKKFPDSNSSNHRWLPAITCQSDTWPWVVC
jgi:hypothetical protein